MRIKITKLNTGEYHSDRRTDLSSAAGDIGEHGLPERTHKTALPVLPTSVPSSPIIPINRAIESGNKLPIKEKFFNRISSKRT